MRALISVFMVPLALAQAASAQAAEWRFHWQTGQVLTYRVEHVTSAAEVVDGKKTESTSKLNNIKRWQVLAVDAEGVATLQLSLLALRMETTTPSGEVMLFDSAHPDKSNPNLRDQLTKFVNTPLAVLRVDGLGKVVEVKESKFGPASRFESEPPFVLTLPPSAPTTGQVWERAYQITLEPPQGTGEKHDAVQRYVCRGIQGTAAIVAMATGVKKLPESLLDQVPLLQMQPEGEIAFDFQAGLFRGARLRVEKELKNHQGEGSSYLFKSNYTEEYVSNP